ncbi:MAG: hypothetical protein AAF988_01840 [Pseudomonadota bacterium]
MDKNKFFLTVLFALAVSLGGCSNTWDGAGKDLSGFGQWLEETF